MGFFSDVKDAFSGGHQRGGRNVGGNSNISNARPRARPANLTGEPDGDDFGSGTTFSALGGALNFTVAPHQRGSGPAANIGSSRTIGSRGVNPDRERQENEEFVEGVSQGAGRGRAVSRRIASDTPQRTGGQRRAASSFRRTGNLGMGQRPLLPVTSASRALKALTGQ